jgi:hypothetical protein
MTDQITNWISYKEQDDWFSWYNISIQEVIHIVSINVPTFRNQAIIKDHTYDNYSKLFLSIIYTNSLYTLVQLILYHSHLWMFYVHFLILLRANITIVMYWCVGKWTRNMFTSTSEHLIARMSSSYQSCYILQGDTSIQSYPHPHIHHLLF